MSFVEFNLLERIKKLEDINEELKVIRFIRSYMSYYGKRQKGILNKVIKRGKELEFDIGKIKITQSQFSKIMNESLEDVNKDKRTYVISILLEMIDVNKFITDILDIDKVDKNIQEEIAKLGKRLEEFKSKKDEIVMGNL